MKTTQDILLESYDGSSCNMNIEQVLYTLSKYQNIREKQLRSGEHDYSLLNSLLSLNSEVHLHSRFIYSMINPNSLHYQGTRFLEPFLQQIEHPALTNFIDPNKAKVLNEYKDIDLLIHDGSHFLIIENKLNAVDQKNQITRYIKTIHNEFGNNEGFAVAVIYLSKTKTRPTMKNDSTDSLIGFDLNNDHPLFLTRNQNDIASKVEGLNIQEGTTIPYVHLPYLALNKNSVSCWVNECLTMSNNLPEIHFAFTEYKKVLQRLDKSKPWRKVMTLTEYALQQETDKQNEIFSFMVESRKSMFDFLAERILQETDKLLPNIELINNAQHKSIKKSFTLTNIKHWLSENGVKENRKNVGFSYENSQNEVVVFCLGVDRGYWGLVDSDGGFVTISNAFFQKSSLIAELVNTNDGLPRFLAELNIRAKQPELKPKLAP